VRAASQSPNDPIALLRGLHDDFQIYVHDVRSLSSADVSISPQALYSGLVRIGGADPRLRGDAPASGRGARNDIVIFASTLDSSRAPAWRKAILDHEYFHARHLARGWTTPLVDFGDAGTNHDYYEAVAWGYVLLRARGGAYGEIRAEDLREITALYTKHFQAFRAFILDRQPTAWVHYGRFMPDMDEDGSLRGAPAARDDVIRSTSLTAPAGNGPSVHDPR